MMLSLPTLPPTEKPIASLDSSFLSSTTLRIPGYFKSDVQYGKRSRNMSIFISCSSLKVVRNPSLDKHVVQKNRIRFVQKLKTLLLSKPKHYIPMHILCKCRSYLSLPKPRSILSMIHRYPSIFELFLIPTPATPMNATKPLSQLCVRLAPAVAALATEELNPSASMSVTLASKLQKLLMLSSHRRLLLSKLVHLAPDLGLPPNFRSRLCNDHPDKFKIVDTSYGRALELLSWDPALAMPLRRSKASSELIVDRPLKFKQLKLWKGFNLKRRHRDFLIKFEELPDVCPYNTSAQELAKESIQAEKRACAVVREVLSMTVEKMTLVDHLTHFRKEFGLPNKLRGMIARHPELFYVSLKGLRNHVLLVEGFDERGTLLEKDQSLVMKDKLMELVGESKRMRKERRKARINGNYVADNKANDQVVDYRDDYDDDDFGDGLEDLFEDEDSDLDHDCSNESNELPIEDEEFWASGASSALLPEQTQCLKPW